MSSNRPTRPIALPSTRAGLLTSHPPTPHPAFASFLRALAPEPFQMLPSDFYHTARVISLPPHAGALYSPNPLSPCVSRLPLQRPDRVRLPKRLCRRLRSARHLFFLSLSLDLSLRARLPPPTSSTSPSRGSTRAAPLVAGKAGNPHAIIASLMASAQGGELYAAIWCSARLPAGHNRVASEK